MRATQMPVQKTIVAVGETLWDLLPSGAMLGGAPFNFACRANSLGDRGIIVTRLGRDEYGRRALEQIAALGMATSYIQSDVEHPTGTVKVKLDAHGNPEFSIVPDAAYDFIETNDALIELAASADCFCFGTLVQRAPESRRTLGRMLEAAAKAAKFLDINLRKDCYTLETITDSLRRADILKMNLQEAHYLAELFEISISSLPEFCSEMLEEWSLKCCLVTMADRGAFSAASDGTKVYIPGHAVPVVDTCGSGDAFSAGFVHEFLRSQPLADCCRLGNALGALVARQKGATTPISAGEISDFVQAKHQMFHEPTLIQFSVG